MQPQTPVHRVRRQPTLATNQHVLAVVVAFEPDSARLSDVLDAVLPQVQNLLVVDNSESIGSRRAVAELVDDRRFGQSTNILTHTPEHNIGLAAAYNVAIERAETLGADYLLLLDQDSVVANVMVARLLAGLAQAGKQAAAMGMAGEPATVGPQYTDELSGRRSVVLRSSTFSLERIETAPGGLNPLPTEMLISSGSLIPMSAFVELGNLDERLFIDHIDTDWALRVYHAGRWMAVIPDAGMSHQLGDRTQRVWWGRERMLPVHSAQRLYYIYRNSLWLYARPHAHWRWVLFDLKRLAAVLLIHVLASGPRWPRLKMIGRGVWHGVRGWQRTG